MVLGRLVGAYRIGLNVEQALREAVENVNEQLKVLPGKISKGSLRVIVKAGFRGGGVQILLVVDEEAEDMEKFVVGANCRGFEEDKATDRAIREIQRQLDELGGGELVDVHSTVITVPGQAYSTIIVAVNRRRR